MTTQFVSLPPNLWSQFYGLNLVDGEVFDVLFEHFAGEAAVELIHFDGAFLEGFKVFLGKRVTLGMDLFNVERENVLG